MKFSQTLIIAEIGKNFIQKEELLSVAEYLNNAKELVNAAKKAGADLVKFQTHSFDDEQLNIPVTSHHFKSMDRYSWVKRNTEITPLKEFWIPLKKYCEKLDIGFFSTPMSRNSAKLLNKLDIPLFKIGSGDILDFVMLDYIATTNKPLIISSGMSTLEEVDKMVNFLKKRKVDFSILHCVSKYPCPPEELNLGTVDFFKKRYKIPIGFSDHSLSIEPAIVAVSLGAQIIEKHFSLSRDFWGSDHKSSLLPKEFKKLVIAIRAYENDKTGVDDKMLKKYYGKKEKIMDKKEASFRQWFRKSLVASQDLKKGLKLSPQHLNAMRPQKLAGGIPSEEYESLIGKTITKNLTKHQPLFWKNIK
jgi:N,N'-diacetyllegionaminate synthase